MGRLDGKVALITGGARGMGKSHVRHFVAEGARVVFGDVLDDKGQAVAAKLRRGDVPLRAPRRDQRGRLGGGGATAMEAFGKLDVLVNNAGVLTFAPIADMPLAEFRRVLEINAVGCWLGMKSVIEPMTAAGGGSIVNISSVEGFTGAAGLSAYSASKFAVRGMTKAAAQELGRLGIRVNSVHPGGVLTSMTLSRADTFDHVDAEALFKVDAHRPVRRTGRDLPAGHVPGLGRVVLLDRQRVHRRRRAAVRPRLLGSRMRSGRDERRAHAGRPGGHRHRRGERAGPGRGAWRWPRPAPGWC